MPPPPAERLDVPPASCQRGLSVKEPADKPGSVVGNHSSGIAVTSGLKRPTRESVGRRFCAHEVRRHSPIWSCSRWGLPCRGVLPAARCALTAPFHPYQNRCRFGRYIFCGTFRRLAPPRYYLAPCPPEPGLSSRNRCRNIGPSDCLAGSSCDNRPGPAKSQVGGAGYPPDLASFKAFATR